MPCAEERRDCVDYNSMQVDQEREQKLEEEVIRLEAMLCALCTETDPSLQIRAESEGACDNIREWFINHRKEDIIRLATHGLPEEPSRHELTLFNKMFD